MCFEQSCLPKVVSNSSAPGFLLFSNGREIWKDSLTACSTFCAVFSATRPSKMDWKWCVLVASSVTQPYRPCRLAGSLTLSLVSIWSSAIVGKLAGFLAQSNRTSYLLCLPPCSFHKVVLVNPRLIHDIHIQGIQFLDSPFNAHYLQANFVIWNVSNIATGPRKINLVSVLIQEWPSPEPLQDHSFFHLAPENICMN